MQEDAEQELKDGCEKICLKMSGKSKSLIKARIFEYIMKNAFVSVCPDEIFADRLYHFDIIGDLRIKWQKEVEADAMKGIIEKNNTAHRCNAYSSEADFSHTCPDWERILKLGVKGILDEMKIESQKDGLTEDQKIFYESCTIVYNAIIVYMKRLAIRAREINSEKSMFLAEALENLTEYPPQTMHEAMELTFVFYYLQTFVEKVNVRSLGKPDRLYERFYRADIESGRFTEEQMREIIRYFLYRLNAVEAIANTPFYLCGTDAHGDAFINELSYMFLEEYIALNINDPKIHIGYTPQLDKEYLKMALQAIVSGRNSILFMNDDIAVTALTNIGVDIEDAKNYVPVGCYEPCVMGKEVPCSCSGRVNIPKAVETAISGGFDLMTNEKIGVAHTCNIDSFDDFLVSVKEQLRLFVDRTMEQINEYEHNFMKINPAPLFSGTMEECVKNGIDAYAGGAKYNNSSINAFGLATAVDAIIGVKKAVFEEKLVTLSELADILRQNWKGHEELRLKCKNFYPKYGNNNSEADEVMIELTEYIDGLINGQHNGRGGIYRCGYFSIDWYSEFGRTTSALPSGRLAGAPLSKNMNAVIGCDKNGVTQIINSVTKLNYKKIPNGTVLDLMLHTSVVKGYEGIAAMLGILEVYMKKGGMALQINVLNPALLKKAQMQPDQYSTLQVRLCGWNVYFVNLSMAEQNEFICMSEHAQEVQV